MKRAVTIVIVLIASAPALAETPLTALKGNWAGAGTDRATPLQSSQNTNCTGQITVEANKLVSDTRCSGIDGLRKRSLLTVTFDGSSFTGEVVQTTGAKDGKPDVLKGKVTGERKGDQAEFTARFPGLTPNAHVAMVLTSANAFSMRVKVLGSTLTDVNFHR